MYAIKLENISFSQQKKLILDNISAHIPKDGLNILLGINGSGKSTLLKIIMNLQTNYQGKVYIFNIEQSRLRAKDKAQSIGFLGQFFQNVFPFKVKDLLLTGRAAFQQFSPTKQDYIRIEEVLEQMQIQYLRDAIFTKLSGGEQQLVLIARVLMQNPKILLFDEPTNHLDIYYQQRVLKLLKNLSSQGYTILCTLHNPTQALQFADQLLLMHNRKLFIPNSKELEDGTLLSKIYRVSFRKVYTNLDDNKYTFIAE